MRLMTKEIERELAKYPFGSQDGKGMGAKVIVKYFNPYGAGTWLITEGEKDENGKWILYGYCHIFEWEWGEVALEELERLRPIRGLDIGIERDLYVSKNSTVRDCVNYR